MRPRAGMDGQRAPTAMSVYVFPSVSPSVTTRILAIGSLTGRRLGDTRGAPQTT